MAEAHVDGPADAMDGPDPVGGRISGIPVAKVIAGRGIFRIPVAKDAGWPSRVVWMLRTGPFVEAFRHLALRVSGQFGERAGGSILITSALPQEGKTLTACNLALAFASLTSSTERVALVDFDLRLPGVASAFDLEPQVGMAEVLRGDAPLTAAAVVTEAALDIYPVAKPCSSAHQVLARPELAEVLKRLEAAYRYVICDAPPVLPVPDVQILAPHMSACLAVVRSGRTPRSALRELVGRLPPEKTLGFFLNDARPPLHARHYYRSRYYEDAGAGEDT